jgi:hypothetical protein
MGCGVIRYSDLVALPAFSFPASRKSDPDPEGPGSFFAHLTYSCRILLESAPGLAARSLSPAHQSRNIGSEPPTFYPLEASFPVLVGNDAISSHRLVERRGPETTGRAAIAERSRQARPPGFPPLCNLGSLISIETLANRRTGQDREFTRESRIRLGVSVACLVNQPPSDASEYGLAPTPRDRATRESRGTWRDRSRTRARDAYRRRARCRRWYSGPRRNSGDA